MSLDKKIILLAIYWLSFFDVHAQIKLLGVVTDAKTNKVLSGTSVGEKGTANYTTTDTSGYFFLTTQKIPATIVVSYVGYYSKEIVVHEAIDSVFIQLDADTTILADFKDHYYKSEVDIGYFGLADYAPIGFIVNKSVQSIGKTNVDANINFRYFKNSQSNSGYQIAFHKQLTHKYSWKPDNLQLAYTVYDLPDNDFYIHQGRILITNELPRNFAVDVGASYQRTQIENVTTKSYSAIVGFSKLFINLLGNTGIVGRATVNDKYAFLDIGAYKGISIGKKIHTILAANYFNYSHLSGFQLSLQLSIVNTRYYCCSSPGPFYHYLNIWR